MSAPWTPEERARLAQQGVSSAKCPKCDFVTRDVIAWTQHLQGHGYFFSPESLASIGLAPKAARVDAVQKRAWNIGCLVMFALVLVYLGALAFGAWRKVLGG